MFILVNFNVKMKHAKHDNDNSGLRSSVKLDIGQMSLFELVETLLFSRHFTFCMVLFYNTPVLNLKGCDSNF